MSEENVQPSSDTDPILSPRKRVRSLLLTAVPFLLVFQLIVVVLLLNLDKFETRAPNTFPRVLQPLPKAHPSDTLLTDVRFLPDSTYSYISVYRMFGTECLVLDPFFDVQRHIDLGQQVPWRSVSRVDLDGDGLDELVYIRVFASTPAGDPFTSVIDSIHVCGMDADFNEIIFDRLRANRLEGIVASRDARFRSLKIHWPTAPDGVHPAQSAEYFALSLGDDAFDEPFRQLRIYRKGDHPRKVAEVRLPVTVREGIWRKLPDGRHVFTGAGTPLAFGTRVPVKLLSPDGRTRPDTLDDTRGVVAQVDDRGNLLWVRSLGGDVGQTYLRTSRSQPQVVQALWRSLERMPTEDIPQQGFLLQLDLASGVLRDSTAYTGTFLPIQNSDPNTTGRLGFLFNQGELAVLGDESETLSSPALEQLPHPPMIGCPAGEQQAAWLLNGTDRSLLLINDRGETLALFEGGRAAAPLPRQHRLGVEDDIPVHTGAHVRLFRAADNPSTFWLLQRYKWAVILLIPTPLLLLGVYFFFQYRAERKRTRKQRELYYQTLELRVKMRTRELEEANEQLTAEMVARRSAEQEAQSQRERLEVIFHGVNYGLAAIRRDGTVSRVNQAFSDLHGYSVASLEKGDLDTLFPEQGDAVRSLTKDAFAGKVKDKEYQLDVDLPSGDNRILQVKTTLLKDAAEQGAELLLTVRDVTHLHRLQKLVEERHQYHNIIGHAPEMQEVFQLLDDLSSSLSTVLITGESGTGKELVAAALHYGSSRAEGPYIKVNCAALSETLLESELFGHTRGAFTGAAREKAGLFEAARGGAIFLDEIGDISPKMQVSLLRVLQEGEFQRVGETKTRKTDARIIAATNRNLKSKIADGSFREDLYYRLNVVHVPLPPLRDRRDDIPLLVEHFMVDFNKQMQKRINGIDDDALELLIQHDWPGNIRELQNILERAFIVCRDEMLRVEHLPAELRAEPLIRDARARRDATAQDKAELDDEAAYVLEIIEACHWNVSEAARRLGISRQALHKKMNKHNLQRPE